jgi:Arc/MetJ family transcription regulator
MRTTITIAEDLLAEAQKVSGKSGYSEAIVTSLQDYLALRRRLALLEDLFTNKPPHTYRRLKTMRRKQRWSS